MAPINAIFSRATATVQFLSLCSTAWCANGAEALKVAQVPSTAIKQNCSLKAATVLLPKSAMDQILQPYGAELHPYDCYSK